MVQTLEFLIYAAAPVAFVLLAITVYKHARLIRSLGMGREGLLLFWQSLSLKMWVAAFLLWVLLGTAFGPFPLPWRRGVSLAFAAAIVAQAGCSVIINHRWREPKRRGH